MTVFANGFIIHPMMTFELENITRKNHVRSLAAQARLDRTAFIRETMYHLKLARNTAEKAYDGATDLSMEVVEKIAVFFEVTKEEVLETVIKK